MMRALTLTQPWAACCVARVAGAEHPPKRHETRGWAPPKESLPFELAIHAGKSCPRDVREYLVDETGHLIEPYRAIVEELGFTARDPWRRERGRSSLIAELPLAAVIGVVTVKQIFKTTGTGPGGPDGELGDFSVGRFAWRLEDAFMLPQPISCRGYQGLWTLEESDEAHVRRQLPRAA